jgi:GxxExxY protein
VIGAAIEVHRALGAGFAREVYMEALALELVVRKVPFRRNLQIPLTYKDAKLGVNFNADFVCFGEMLVEIAVRDEMTPRDYTHVVNHLKATGHSRALLLNFGGPLLQHQRLSPPPAGRGD